MKHRGWSLASRSLGSETVLSTKLLGLAWGCPALGTGKVRMLWRGTAGQQQVGWCEKAAELCLTPPLRSASEKREDSEFETGVSTSPQYCHSLCLSSLAVRHTSRPHGPRGGMRQNTKQNTANGSSWLWIQKWKVPCTQQGQTGEGRGWRTVELLPQFKQTEETVGNPVPVKMAGKERVKVSWQMKGFQKQLWKWSWVQDPPCLAPSSLQEKGLMSSR